MGTKLGTIEVKTMGTRTENKDRNKQNNGNKGGTID